MQVITIGLDIAKNVFQVHGVDNAGHAVLRRKVRRDQLIPLLRDMEPCLIGMEACATAHHWARELIALGHEVKLMPPAYVKAYVKRNKNDAADAEAICEAVTRPTMRFVPVKSADAQSILMLASGSPSPGPTAHSADQRDAGASGRVWHRRTQGPGPCPRSDRSCLTGRCGRSPRWRDRCCCLIARDDRGAWRANPEDRDRACWRGIARTRSASDWQPFPASASSRPPPSLATVVDAQVFRSGRQFAAWLGLVPKQHSSGGKERMGAISKMGDRYLRHLLVVGATAVVRYTGARRRPSAPGRTSCSSVSRPDWSQSLSPTRWRGSPGP